MSCLSLFFVGCWVSSVSVCWCFVSCCLMLLLGVVVGCVLLVVVVDCDLLCVVVVFDGRCC